MPFSRTLTPPLSRPLGARGGGAPLPVHPAGREKSYPPRPNADLIFSPEKGTDWNELDGFQKMEKTEMFKIWFKREFKAYNHIFYVVVLSFFILINTLK